MTRLVRTTMLAAFVALLVAGCDSTGPRDDLEGQFSRILLEAGNASTAADVGETVLDEQTDEPEDLEDGTMRICSHQRVSAMRAGGGSAGFPLFDPGAGVIYPGSLLQGATLKQAPPDPIAVKRAGGTVSINIVNGSQGVYREVDEVTQGRIVQAMNDIIGDNTGVLPSNFTMSLHDARTREQFALSLGFEVGTAFTTVEGKFSMRTDRQYSRLLVKLTQSYYTMSFQLPTSHADLFAPDVTPADLARQIGPGNPGTYISDVTYGRVYYMLVESTASQLELSAALDASFNGAFVDGRVTADMDYLRESSELNISLFALGGEAGATIRTFGETDLSALRDLFAESSDIRTGVPLSYVVRNVVDNRIVATQLATEYDLVDCRIYSNMHGRLAFRFDAASEFLTHEPFTLTNGDEARYLDRWREEVSANLTTHEDHGRMFNWVKGCASHAEIDKVRAVFGGRVHVGGVNEQNFVQFNGHRTPGLDAAAHPFTAADTVIHVFPWHRFNGRALEGTDFTIFVVARSTATAENIFSSNGQYYLFTNQRDDYHRTGQTVIVGWNRLGNAEMHIRGRGGVQIAVNRGTWSVYAFRLSELEGMSVFVNSKLNRADNANQKHHLQQFIGASIGVLQQRHFAGFTVPGPPFGFPIPYPEDACHNYTYAGGGTVGVDLAFLEAYTVSASEDQIDERMKELADRFGIF